MRLPSPPEMRPNYLYTRRVPDEMSMPYASLVQLAPDQTKTTNSKTSRNATRPAAAPAPALCALSLLTASCQHTLFVRLPALSSLLSSQLRESHTTHT